MPTKEAIIEGLKGALQVMNDTGRHWTQGTLRDLFPDYTQEPRYCSLGALYYVTGVRVGRVVDGYDDGFNDADMELQEELIKSLAQAVPEEFRTTVTSHITSHNKSLFEADRQAQEYVIVRYNDENKREWKEIVALFERAEALVEEEA